MAALQQQLADAEQRRQTERLIAQRDLLGRLLALRDYLDPADASGLEQRLASEDLLDDGQMAALETLLEGAQGRRMAEVRAEQAQQLAAQRDLLNQLLTVQGYLEPGEVAELERQLVSEDLLGADRIAALEERLAEAEQSRMAALEAERARKLASQRDLLNRLLAFRAYLDPAEVSDLEARLAREEPLGSSEVAGLERRLEQAEQAKLAEVQRQTIDRLLALDTFLTPDERARVEPLAKTEQPLSTTQMAGIEELLNQAERRRPKLLFYDMPRPRPL